MRGIKENKLNEKDVTGPQAKGCRQLRQGGKGKDMDSPLEPPEETELTS